VSDQLTIVEAGRLRALEAVVERGLQTFVEVGVALSEIRDRRLYRVTHATFQHYCRARWGFSRQRALQLIDAAEMTTTVVTAGLPAPANERQARVLVPALRADEAAAIEAWRQCAEEYGEDMPRLPAKVVVNAISTRATRRRRERQGQEAGEALLREWTCTVCGQQAFSWQGSRSYCRDHLPPPPPDARPDADLEVVVDLQVAVEEAGCARDAAIEQHEIACDELRHYLAHHRSVDMEAVQGRVWERLLERIERDDGAWRRA
jgi:hypothetical protein